MNQCHSNSPLKKILLMKFLLPFLALTFFLPLSQGVKAYNEYLYIINDLDIPVMVHSAGKFCIYGPYPESAHIAPHTKKTITLDISKSFAKCWWMSSKAYFGLTTTNFHDKKNLSMFKYYKKPGKDPYITLLDDPDNIMAVENSTTLRIKHHK